MSELSTFPAPSAGTVILRRRVISRRVKTSDPVTALLADLALPRDQDRADRFPHAAEFMAEVRS